MKQRVQLDHLRGPGFARLWKNTRARLEREPEALSSARTSLRQPSDVERDAIGGLLGKRFGGATITVGFEDVDSALREATGHGLVHWLERLGGPLRDKPAEQRVREAAIQAAVSGARRSVLAGESFFELWLDGLQGAALTRMEGEGALERLQLAVQILEQLPAQDVPIAVFASDCLGNTKVLDDTPLERLVLKALALRAGVPVPDGADTRRALWERFGVVPDDLAAQVLVLNLPAVGDGVLDRLLAEGASHGLPLRVTLHQLMRHPPVLAPGPVYVCENPAILRIAAERLGASCLPLVATEGRPGTAFWRLMARCPGPVRVRADFDKVGVEIVRDVLERTGGEVWRFDAETYGVGAPVDVELPKALPETPWDPALRVAMERQLRVEEESLLTVLLQDLGER